MLEMRAGLTLEFDGEFAPKKPSFIWRGFRIAVGFASETPLSVLGFLVLGVVLRVLFPPLAGAAFALSLATLASKFTWKVLSLTNVQVFHTIERWAVTFQQEHPYLQAALVAAAFGLAILSEGLSILAGTLLGIFNGIIVETNHRYMIIEKKRLEAASNRKGDASLNC